MRILFDQGVPAPLRDLFTGHDVSTAYERGWSTMSNGDLLEVAAGAFDLFITTDRNLRHQQNLAQWPLSILVLPTTSWPVIREHGDSVVREAVAMAPGQYRELAW